VPTVPEWKLSALPRYLETDDVERVITSCDLSKPCGIRDRAILLLLARLGLRAGDITAMRLDDLDWHAGTVRVRGKGRREICLPLPQDAGDALIEYLMKARPRVDTDRVFLCVNAPVRPFATSASISDISGVLFSVRAFRTLLQEVRICFATLPQRQCYEPGPAWTWL
jgi:integrase